MMLTLQRDFGLTSTLSLTSASSVELSKGAGLAKPSSFDKLRMTTVGLEAELSEYLWPKSRRNTILSTGIKGHSSRLENVPL